MEGWRTTGRGRCRVHKLYVPVVTRHEADGTVTPLVVCWPDGRSFPIDEVLERGELGQPTRGRRQARYRIRMGSHETDLWMELTEAVPAIGERAKVRWWVFAYDQVKPGHATERSVSSGPDSA